ncbi:hypothetical protein [Deinococcus sonorensis]|uniref:Uncharacterized protein n=2 Tax=Deinococcus sonorensis TaxID=309891 RepID=A0AAU7U6R5_9DEIO
MPVAVGLLTGFREAHILSRLSRAEEILASGFQPKSPGAFLVDVIKDTAGKYDPAAIIELRHRGTGHAQRARR